MKRFAIMIAILFVCSSAFGVQLYSEAVDGNLTHNLHSLPFDSIGMAGLSTGSDPANTITAGTHTILGTGAAPNDGDGFNFTAAGAWSVNFSQTGGAQFLWLKTGHDNSGTQVYGDFTGNVVDFTYADVAGMYSIGWYDNQPPAGWSFEITVEGAPEPPPSAVPEPAGLGLVGLALLAVRKRRS